MKITATVVDITTLAVDAIVNAANEQLSRGGGVCGAIHRAAGPELERASRLVGSCPTGEARVTPGFGLAARHVIHAVGPVWRGGNHHEAESLSSSYRQALTRAVECHCRSIAFPAISTGIYGYPLDEATTVAVATVRAFAATSPGIDEVIFACFDQRTFDAYAACGVAVE
ncbi:MAG: macro domain-containing protein [Gemmatimonadaceae bacterium]|nr:macro domain-containing protein [Gemmatimonadaceae bacterium]